MNIFLGSSNEAKVTMTMVGGLHHRYRRLRNLCFALSSHKGLRNKSALLP